jgi:hypothetical protein
MSRTVIAISETGKSGIHSKVYESEAQLFGPFLRPHTHARAVGAFSFQSVRLTTELVNGRELAAIPEPFCGSSDCHLLPGICLVSRQIFRVRHWPHRRIGGLSVPTEPGVAAVGPRR